MSTDTSSQRVRTVSNYLTAIAGLSGLILSVTFGFWRSYNDTIKAERINAMRSFEVQSVLRETLKMQEQYSKRLSAETGRTQAQITALEAQVRLLKPTEHGVAQAAIDEIANIRVGLAATQDALKQNATKLTAADARMARLEQVILADPQKAVAIPLLQRDVASLDARITREVESLRSDNARIYDLMKWLVGLMGLVSLSLVGTAVGNLFKRESREAQSNTGDGYKPRHLTSTTADTLREDVGNGMQPPESER